MSEYLIMSEYLAAIAGQKFPGQKETGEFIWTISVFSPMADENLLLFLSIQ